MPTAAIIALIIIIAIMLIIAYFWFRHCYKKGEKYAEKAAKIAPNLEITNLHLKFKGKFFKQALIYSFSCLFLALGIIFLIYLPIFKIEYKLLDIKLGENSFSYYDNYITVKDTLNHSINTYSDIPTRELIGMTVWITLSAILIFLAGISNLIKAIKYTSTDALNDYIDAKADKKSFLDRSDAFFNILAFGAIIFAIVHCFTCKYKIPENATFKIEKIDNFIYYYSTSGGKDFKVLQNNFKFCNGVSALIILPIICCVVGIILFIISRYLKNKLVAEIQNEKLDEPQAVETTNENDNIE